MLPVAPQLVETGNESASRRAAEPLPPPSSSWYVAGLGADGADRRARLVLISKSGLVADIVHENVEGKLWTASFISYLAVRMKLRS